jgi:hypothetical protein
MVDDPTLLKRRFIDITTTWFSGEGDEQTSAYSGMNDRPVKGDEFPVASLPARLPRELRVIRVFYRNKSVVCIVDDIGPWNVRDRYWEYDPARPAAEYQHRMKDDAQNGRVPANSAGLDLSLEAWRELGLGDIIQRIGMVRVDWEFVFDPVVIKKTWDNYMALFKDSD